MLDVIGDGEEADGAVDTALERIETLVDAMAVISPIVFRNVTGTCVPFHDRTDLKFQVSSFVARGTFVAVPVFMACEGNDGSVPHCITNRLFSWRQTH